jgi:hypothetical protein
VHALTSIVAKPPQSDRPLSRRRKWAFRLAAIALGLSVLAAAEGVCILGGWGRPTDYPDPYVGFSEVHPLFVLNDGGTRYEIAKSRRTYFAKQSFPATKGENTFRIFCLGGSTVQGRPYSTATSFATWLQLSLAAGDDRRTWEVVNCGGISYASYRLTPILKECLDYEPDLFVICTGHNEFLEDRTFSHIKHAPPVIAVPMRRLSRLRTVTLLRSLASRIRGKAGAVPDDRPILPADTSPLLDVENNQLKAYHRDEAWRAGVIEHFEFNLRRMIDIAAAADVPVVLVLPPSNLRDMPPFKSEDTSGLSAKALSRWRSLVAQARGLSRTDPESATGLLEQAARVNGRHAATWYELGCLYDALWRKTRDDRYRDKARSAYVRARDEDICPLRMISPLEAAMRRVAEGTGTPLIDAHALLESKVPDGILGDEYLVDHIHPSPVDGHQTIAAALVSHLEQRGDFQPSSDWHRRRDAAYRRHLTALARDEKYFIRGRQTLKALDAWAKGRAEAMPARTRQQRRD